MNTIAKILLCLALPCLLAACATGMYYQAYNGEPLPDSAQARAVGLLPERGCNYGGERLLVLRVDGVATSRFFGYGDSKCSYPAEVLLKPGSRRLFLMYSNGSSPAYTAVCANVEAGHVYDIMRRVAGYNTVILVKDRQSGAIANEATDAC